MNKHAFHIVSPSLGLLRLLSQFFIGPRAYKFFHEKDTSFLIAAFILVTIIAGFWWRDVNRESCYSTITLSKCFKD